MIWIGLHHQRPEKILQNRESHFLLIHLSVNILVISYNQGFSHLQRFEPFFIVARLFFIFFLLLETKITLFIKN